MRIAAPNGPLGHWQRAVLNAGLADFPTKTWLSEASPLDDMHWQELCEWAQEQRVIGLLWSLTAEAPITEPQRQVLSTAWHASSVNTMVVEASLPPVADLLNAAGIDWRLLKGVATSRLVYPERGLRSFSDIDILVRPKDMSSTLDALLPITATGAVPLHGPFRSNALQERQITDRRGVELDVHRAVEGSLVTSRLPVEAFFEEPIELEIAGKSVRTPPIEVSFVHAVMHFSSAGRRLSTVPDIARLIRDVDPHDRVISRMLCTHSSRALFHWSLSMAGQWTDLPSSWHEYLAVSAPSKTARRVVDWVQTAPNRSSAANTLLGGNRVRRLKETLRPTSEFLDYMGTTQRQHLQRLFSKGRSL